MQRRMKLVAATAAAAALTLGAGLAHAQMNGGESCGMRHGPGMMGRQMVERYDANKDGSVTQQEIEQNRAQWLAEFDADKNGTLSLDEFKLLWLKARNEMMVREFQFFDRDGNAQLTLEEYQAPAADLANGQGRPGWRQGWRHGPGMDHRMDHRMSNRGERGMADGMLPGMGHPPQRGAGPCMGDDDGPPPPPPGDQPPPPPGNEPPPQDGDATP